MKLPDSAWRHREGLDRLLVALGAAEGLTRFVGGAVRDALIGVEATDVDCATRLLPEESLARIAAAGFNAVPIGIAHGTVTAILPGGPIEVTTLRRDVATDGRHATVAFTDEWRVDAARRDFTINALSADPDTGEIHDYFGGIADLDAGRVRFIGEALVRIAEDHLRILRFFRFHARFGRGAPDMAALDACEERANDLMALSRERIADELLKILAVPIASTALDTMCAHRILVPVLPEIVSAAPLRTLEVRERAAGVAPDPLRRLAALLPPDPEAAAGVGARLKLSNRARKRLVAAAERSGEIPPDIRPLAYRLGAEGASDRILLAELDEATTRRALDLLREWQRPTLPISGGQLIGMGLSAGPQVAATLQAIERQWIVEGFPDAARTRDIARILIAQQLRAAQ
ncbi:MAG: [cytidine(C)-cytidine(C)-adenosine (A)]-adding enzyme [Sphingomonas bacterium]|nr:[cytidine(C)-cytidine(C)-adenosine (A)]-adding enzyme [Sphingomonas bacterium]